MEDKLKLEFVVNQIQDNGNTSASLVSVEHKPTERLLFLGQPNPSQYFYMSMSSFQHTSPLLASGAYQNPHSVTDLSNHTKFNWT